jgi:hypothetical protein
MLSLRYELIQAGIVVLPDASRDPTDIGCPGRGLAGRVGCRDLICNTVALHDHVGPPERCSDYLLPEPIQKQYKHPSCQPNRSECEK